MVSVGSKSQVWALQPAGQILKWNGSGWTAIPGGLSYISAAADGTVWGISSNRQIWQWNGSNWVFSPGGCDEISVASKYAVYCRTGILIYSYDPSSSTWAQVTGAPSARDLAANADGGLWVLDTNDAVHYSSDLSTWTAMQGLVGLIASGGKYMTMGQSSGQIWHFNNLLASIDGSTSGNYATWCNNHPQGCPQGSVHTATYQVTFPHGMYGSKGSASGSPSTQLNAVSSDIPNPFNCDMLFGNPSSPECQATEAGNASCTKMGTLFGAGNFFPFDIEEAHTRTKWTGGPGYDCYTSHKITCWFPVTVWCTADHLPADFNPLYNVDVVGAKDGFGQWLPIVGFGWDAAAWCGRLKADRGTGLPWHCSPGISIFGDLDDPNTAPADCDHNP